MGVNLFNPKVKNRLGTVLLLGIDFFTVFIIITIAGIIRSKAVPALFESPPPFSISIDFAKYHWIFPLWLIILAYNGAYSRRFTFWDEVRVLWRSTFFISLAVFTILFIGKAGADFSRSFILITCLLSLAVFPVSRTSGKRLLYSMGLLKRKIIILGTGEIAVKSLSVLRNEANLGYEIAGFIGEGGAGKEKGLIEGIKVHGFLEKAERYIKRCSIHDVLIAVPEMSRERLAPLINRLQQKTENMLFVPDLAGVAVLGTELRHFLREQTIMLEMKNNLLRPVNFITKRVFDFLLGLLMFLLFIVPILVISVLIKATSKGPAIFRQERITRDGRPFKCYKFRTMYLDAEQRLSGILASDPQAKKEWETYWKLKDDPRVTRIGRFLRETSLDELPQIFNLLKSEMSLVGPRPVTREEIERYYKDASKTCFSVLPGITGLWQVSGRNNTGYDYRIALDLWYIKNWNLWLDFVILLKTIHVVLKREGAH